MTSLIFRENATDMDEKQILSYLLQFTKSGVNREELAERLLDSFGSLKGILEARPEALQSVKGIGQKTAEYIATFLPVVRLWERLNMETPKRLGCSTDAARYCLSLLGGLRNEEFWVIALNAQCQVLGKRKISTGTLSEVAAYPRSVVETALNYNAYSVIISHNHPGGTCAPSVEDIQSTVQIQKLLKALGIMVVDHIIVAREQTYSMIQHGDIDYRL